ncbi:MAG: DUF4178 domain-containing protein [Candidatus Tectomicrobia bacterium]|uniref:DUF4178 domain-containing protein n=1 Tax=Tectimicrobiota bacterium TaxID=2528274 RepID=A0A932G0L0_UNCTE|nr:DUF4178 domain-containing protein [Candidatus Tectomicrobia bacterium]
MIWNFFKKKGENEPEKLDPLRDLILSRLKVGYLVDYDLRTWEVTGYSRYDWGRGEFSEEWELRCGDETIYLEREEDDEVEWKLSWKISLEVLGPQFKKRLKEEEEPPEEIVYEGVTYTLEGEGAGLFHQNGRGEGLEFLCWDYVDEEGKQFLTLEQWGEEKYELSTGIEVEEYQFSHILPRSAETPERS